MKTTTLFLVLVLFICTAKAAMLYVDLNSPSPAAPYTNWLTAATNIQDAIDAAASGDTILVTNGVYVKGGRVVYGLLTNRVVINKPVRVQSVNGPGVTVIQGYQQPSTTNGNSAIRCVYLTNGAALRGFTLTNGATRDSGIFEDKESSGGGVWCESTNALLLNCVLIGNSAYCGGGAYSGTLNNCRVEGNNGYYSGGVFKSICTHCLITRNSGGGTFFGVLNNCVISFNTRRSSGSDYGSGVSYGIHNNCTIVSNVGIGAYYTVLTNSIIYYNTGTSGYADNCYNSNPIFCCTTLPPWFFGEGINITNAPLFVNQAGGEFHLQSNSPCINAGNNGYVSITNDLDGNPRIIGGVVDIGAYEYQTPSSLLSYAWAQQYGIPTDGSADYLDLDGDQMNNWQEWRAGTVPTNSSSVLQLLSPSNAAPGILVKWQSVVGKTYFLNRAIDLAAQSPFTAIQSNIAGQAGMTSYTDASATNSGPYFYRVGVQQ